MEIMMLMVILIVSTRGVSCWSHRTGRTSEMPEVESFDADSGSSKLGSFLCILGA